MVDRSVVQSGRYKAYPEYKDSGVEWLGEIPSHWQVKRLGQFFKERREKVSDKDYPPLSVTMKGIVPQLENAAKSDAGDNRKLVLKNDFVINSRSDRKGSSGISSLDGSVSLISIVLEPKGISPRYAHHLLRSYNFQEEFYRHGKGIVADLWSTNSSEMKDILIPEISENESNAIASFLDHETAKIDILIEKQQRLIELLTEKRQAVISHAVTKGLNPDVPMKDSGVEWLGEVPEHWEVTKIGWVLEYLSYGFTNPMPTSDEGPYMLTATDISFNEILFDQARTTTTNAYENFITDKSRPKLGDLLLTKDGTLGRVAVFNSTNKTCISQSIALLRPDKKYVLPYFMAAALASSRYQEKMIFDAGGTTIKHIYISVLSKMNLALPDINEQQEIVSYIDSECLKLDDLISKAEQAIQLMRERRTALISAAVTGKIDVRDWVKPESNSNQI